MNSEIQTFLFLTSKNRKSSAEELRIFQQFSSKAHSSNFSGFGLFEKDNQFLTKIQYIEKKRKKRRKRGLVEEVVQV